MKKFFIASMIAMFTVSAVYAEDRVSLEGNLAVRGWDVQDFDDVDSSWWEQRLRIGGKITIADNISAHFRMDIGEGVWGLDYSPGSVARPGYAEYDLLLDSKIHIDRAYLQIDKGKWALTAGQQYMALGIAQVFDANATGMVLALDYNPVTVALVYAKLDERNCVCDNEHFDDLDAYAINIAYAGNGFSTNVFYAKANDGTDLDFYPWALGFNGSTKLGIVDLTGELAFLGGDVATGADTRVDFSGTQLYLVAEAPITDRVNVGAEFMYADGANDDEIQLTTLADWNTFSPMSNNTPMSTEFSALPSRDSFDPFGVSGGVVAGTIFADLTVNELITAGCKIGYFEPESNNKLEGADLLAYNMWIKYQLAPNTYLSGTYMVSSADCDDKLFPEDKKVFVGELVVNF
jgi:hypothetical protein